MKVTIKKYNKHPTSNKHQKGMRLCSLCRNITSLGISVLRMWCEVATIVMVEASSLGVANAAARPLSEVLKYWNHSPKGDPVGYWRKSKNKNTLPPHKVLVYLQLRVASRESQQLSTSGALLLVENMEENKKIFKNSNCSKTVKIVKSVAKLICECQEAPK